MSQRQARIPPWGAGCGLRWYHWSGGRVAGSAFRLCRVSSGEISALIAVERRRAAEMFAGLTDEQWQVRSLCTEWTVRDLAGHLIGPFCIGTGRFLLGGLLSGGLHRASVKLSRELGQRPASEIVSILRANADRPWAPPGNGPLAPLTDLAVHTRDAARPLGLEVTAAPAAWRHALGFLTSARASRGFVPRGRLTGLRLRATDQDWAWGDGPDVSGPGEALAMAAAGRVAALGDLSGDGLPVLRARLSGLR
jgi:uncharacterized protein (TIGR03083 family)